MYEYDSPSSLLSPDEAREMLCVGKSTIYSLLNSCELKGFRIGTRNWRIPREEIDNYIINKMRNYK